MIFVFIAATALTAAAQPPVGPPLPMPPPLVRMQASPPPVSEELRLYLETPGARPARLRSGGIMVDDYPAAAIRAGAQGRVGFRYVVSPEGRVVSCEIVESSGHSILDSTSCSLVQRRFRFYPAQDESGAPVAETRTDRIRWSLPEPPPAPEPQTQTPGA